MALLEICAFPIKIKYFIAQDDVEKFAGHHEAKPTKTLSANDINRTSLVENANVMSNSFIKGTVSSDSIR